MCLTCFRCLKHRSDRAATIDPPRQARGWRYITLQIADIDTVHHDLRSRGVREGLAPVDDKSSLCCSCRFRCSAGSLAARVFGCTLRPGFSTLSSVPGGPPRSGEAGERDAQGHRPILVAAAGRVCSHFLWEAAGLAVKA